MMSKSGRTTRMLEAAVAACGEGKPTPIVVAANARERARLTQELARMIGERGVHPRVVTMEQATEQGFRWSRRLFCGLRNTPVFVDHYAWEERDNAYRRRKHIPTGDSWMGKGAA